MIYFGRKIRPYFLRVTPASETFHVSEVGWV